MLQKGQLLFLGTGASTGVPVIGCRCGVCTSGDQYNRRYRSSVLCRVAGKNFLIDVTPDFRSQALDFGVDRLDGVLFTHTHYDHCGGVDDLRVFYFKNECVPIPCLVSSSSMEELKRLFYYMIPSQVDCGENAGRLAFQMLEDEAGDVNFQGINFSYFSYKQQKMCVNGFRIGDCAYITDIRDYNENIFTYLRGVRSLVVSALRFSSSLFHFNIDEAIDFAERVGAEKTWLTHISHKLDHQKTNAYLPSGIEMAYDGLEVEFIYD